MKARPLVSILILVLAVLIIVGSCATGKKAYVAMEDEEIYGAWHNPDYDETDKSAMFVFETDGILQTYKTASMTKKWWSGKYTITDKWIDDEGNIWYKFLVTDIKLEPISHSETEKYYYLGKISDSGRVFEFSSSGYDYPPEINPDNLKYPSVVHYRQE